MHPIIEEIDTPLDAAQAFAFFQGRPYSFWLDSGMDPEKLGRYSFLGSDPFLIMRSRGQEITLIQGEGVERLVGNPFLVLRELMSRYSLEPEGPAPVPFLGGAVGYLSYDLASFIERLPSTAVDDLQLPECYFAFYDTVLAYDNQMDKTYIVTIEQRDGRAKCRIEELKLRLASLPPSTAPVANTNLNGELTSNFTHQGYLKAVEAAKEYIKAGDIFEVNLSQRLETPLLLPPYELYRRLRRINPAPFACYLNFPEVAVVSASPERFLLRRGDTVETRPIKGTRPRGRNQEEDIALAQELMESIKDRAEHIMIVDLERNDLGRVCLYGTVRVRELMALESYATVFHLTSTVEGKLEPGRDAIDLLLATFPGGSITGAPKVRAMEIIDELEPTKRSIYTGSIGYISFNGDLDLNIAIRTILVKEGKAYFQVGGAVVYDSDPQAEYQETLDKAKALLQALNQEAP
ncbi:MAG: aminodeoxychorismate synthase component I [Chloroflexi bacterium]|nr:aminodeoxychorismate synthase component I [Chloroflexota bacterium]